MKGLGRNVKFTMQFFLKYQIRCYVVMTICVLLFHCWRDGIGPFLNENVPFYVLGISLTLILFNAMENSNRYCVTAVSQGSARKPAAGGMIVSHHLFVLLQLAILVLMAIVSDSKGARLVRTCPMLIIAVMLMIQGVGIACATLSMKERHIWAAVLLLGFIAIIIAVFVLFGWQHDFKLKIEMLEPYNNLLVLLPGVIFDLIGSVAYYKTVQKVDLKLS